MQDDAVPPELLIVELDILETTNICPGEIYRTQRYILAVVGLINQLNILVAYLDSGCTISLVDTVLAYSLNIPVKEIYPIPVRRIGLSYILSSYVDLPVFFCSKTATTKVIVEAYLVNGLNAQLLISVNVIIRKRFRIDFRTQQARINSCKGLTFLFAVLAKPGYRQACPVYTDCKVVVLPYSYIAVPAYVKGKALPKQDYMFKGEYPNVKLILSLVDAAFSQVKAVNNTDRPYIIKRKVRLGSLYKTKFP